MINKFPILAGDNLKRVCVTDGASNMKSAATQSRLVDQHMLCVLVVVTWEFKKKNDTKHLKDINQRKVLFKYKN